MGAALFLFDDIVNSNLSLSSTSEFGSSVIKILKFCLKRLNFEKRYRRQPFQNFSQNTIQSDSIELPRVFKVKICVY